MKTYLKQLEKTKRSKTIKFKKVFFWKIFRNILKNVWTFLKRFLKILQKILFFFNLGLIRGILKMYYLRQQFWKRIFYKGAVLKMYLQKSERIILKNNQKNIYQKNQKTFLQDV